MLSESPTADAGRDKLLITPREAAETLSVCEKTLWSLTAPRGPIRCVRLGRSVRYSVDALREFIAGQHSATSGEVRHV